MWRPLRGPKHSFFIRAVRALRGSRAARRVRAVRPCRPLHSVASASASLFVSAEARSNSHLISEPTSQGMRGNCWTNGISWGQAFSIRAGGSNGPGGRGHDKYSCHDTLAVVTKCGVRPQVIRTSMPPGGIGLERADISLGLNISQLRGNGDDENLLGPQQKHLRD